MEKGSKRETDGRGGAVSSRCRVESVCSDASTTVGRRRCAVVLSRPRRVRTEEV
jgi:hypothetical protein